MPIAAIVTDIEGTTSSIDFVKHTLFPYARQHLDHFVRQNKDQAHIQVLLESIREDIGTASDLDEIIVTLQHWIDTDQKKTALKTLQGYIWEAGYKQQDYVAHMYPEVLSHLNTWKLNYPLYVYSSGSVKAQHLFFQYSCEGDIRSLFSDFFDTTIGPKKVPQSYRLIAMKIHEKPENILFLSDCPDEICAAQSAGFRTIQLLREGAQGDATSPYARDFHQVNDHILENP